MEEEGNSYYSLTDLWTLLDNTATTNTATAATATTNNNNNNQKNRIPVCNNNASITSTISEEKHPNQNSTSYLWLSSSSSSQSSLQECTSQSQSRGVVVVAQHVNVNANSNSSVNTLTNSTTLPVIWNEDEENSVVSNIQRNIARNDHIRVKEIYERDAMREDFEHERTSLNQRIERLQLHLKRKDELIGDLKADLDHERSVWVKRIDESRDIIQSKGTLLGNQQNEMFLLKNALKISNERYSEEVKKTENNQAILQETSSMLSHCQTEIHNTKQKLMLSSEKYGALEATLASNRIEAKEVIEELTSRIQSDETENTALRTQLKELKTELSYCKGKLEEMQQDSFNEERAQQVLEEQTAQMGHLQEKNSSLLSEINEKMSTIKDTSAQLSSAIDENSALSFELNELRDDFNALTEKCASILSTKTEMQIFIEKLQQDFLNSESNVRSLQDEMSVYEEKRIVELNALQDQFEEKSKDFLAIVEERNQYKKEVECAGSECLELKKGFKRLSNELDEKLSKTLVKLSDANERLKEETNIKFEMEQKVNDLSEENKKLISKVTLLKEVVDANKGTLKDALLSRKGIESDLSAAKAKIIQLEVIECEHKHCNDDLDNERLATDALRKDLEKAQHDLSNLINTSAKKEMDILALEESLKTCQRTHLELHTAKEDEINDIKNSYKEHITKVQFESDAKVLEANEAILELTSEIESVNNEMSSLSSKLFDAQKEIKNLKVIQEGNIDELKNAFEKLNQMREDKFLYSSLISNEKEKCYKSQHDVKELQDTIIELDLTLQEKTSRIQQLEVSANEAIEAKSQIEREFEDCRILNEDCISSIKVEYNEARQDMDKRVVELKSELESLRNDHFIKDDHIINLNRQLTEMTYERSLTMNSEYDELKQMDQSINNYLADIVALEASLKLSREEKDRLVETNSKLNDQVSSLKDTLSVKDEETKDIVSELASELDRVNLEADEVNSSMRQVKDTLNVERKKFESLESSYKLLERKNASLSEENSVLATDIADLQSKLSIESSTLEEMKKSTKFSASERQVLANEVESLDLRLQSSIKELNSMSAKFDKDIITMKTKIMKENKASLDDIKSSNHNLSQELDKYRQRCREVDAKEVSLRDEIVNLRSDLRSEQWQTEQSNEKMRELRNELHETQDKLYKTQDILKRSEHSLAKLKEDFDAETKTMKKALAEQDNDSKHLINDKHKAEEELEKAMQCISDMEITQKKEIEQLQESLSNKNNELQNAFRNLSETREQKSKLCSLEEALSIARNTIAINEGHMLELNNLLEATQTLNQGITCSECNQENIDDIERKLCPSKEALSKAQCVINKYEAVILDLKNLLDSTQEQNIKLEANVSKIQTEIDTRDEEVKVVVKELTNEIEKLRRELDVYCQENDFFSGDISIINGCDVEQNNGKLSNRRCHEIEEIGRLQAYIVESQLKQEQLQLEADQLNQLVRKRFTERVHSLITEIEYLRLENRQLQSIISGTSRFINYEKVQREVDQLNQAIRKNHIDKISSMTMELDQLKSEVDDYRCNNSTSTTECMMLQKEIEDLNKKLDGEKARSDSCEAIKRDMEHQMKTVESRLLILWRKYSKQNKNTQGTQTSESTLSDEIIDPTINYPSKMETIELRDDDFVQRHCTDTLDDRGHRQHEKQRNSENNEETLLLTLHDLQLQLQGLNESYISCQAENDALHSAIQEGENDQQQCLDLLQFENKDLESKLAESQIKINDLQASLNRALSSNIDLQNLFNDALLGNEQLKQNANDLISFAKRPEVLDGNSYLTSSVLKLAQALLPLISLTGKENEKSKTNIEECAQQALSCLKEALNNHCPTIETPTRRTQSPVLTPLTRNSLNNFSSFSLDVNDHAPDDFHREIDRIFIRGEQDIQNILDIFDDRVAKLKNGQQQCSLAGSFSDSSFVTSIGEPSICRRCVTLEREYRDFRQVALSMIEDNKTSNEVEVRAAILQTQIQTKHNLDEKWRLRMLEEASKTMLLFSSDDIPPQRFRTRSI